MSQAPPVPRPPLLRRPAFWLIVVAALLAVGVAVVIGIALGGQRGADASAGPTSAPSTVATDAAATPDSDAANMDAPTGVVIPASCDGIYTRDWSGDFAPLVLNPTWALDPASGVQFGSRDETAIALLTTNSAITCKWGSPNGGSDRGLTTNVADVTEAESAAMLAHFGTSGYNCYEELEGMRCVTETPPSPDGQSGESHFLRDDVWVATLWVNAGPDGYTHDIVAAIFG